MAKEAAILREEKQRELQKLLEMQERANDKAAEQDEIRARQAFEKAEKEIRIQEKAEREKRMKLKID